MQKILLMSILGATLVIPFFAFRGGSVKSAVRRSMIATVSFCVLYWLGLMFVYPVLAPAKKPQQQAPSQ